MGEEEVAGVLGFLFEVGAVAGDKEPVLNLAAQELYRAEGREIFFQGLSGGVGGLRQDDPEAVVLGGFWAFAEPEDEFVLGVDGVGAEHGPDFGVERGESFEDEGVERGLAFGFGEERIVGGGVAGHGGIVAGLGRVWSVKGGFAPGANWVGSAVPTLDPKEGSRMGHPHSLVG